MAALLIAVNIINISCEEIDSKGVKREVSARIGFSSFPQFESLNVPGQKIAMGKTTVEYWPPDMDKKKFYSIKEHDSIMELWPKDMSTEMLLRINEPLILTAPYSLPDIPLKEKDTVQVDQLNNKEPTSDDSLEVKENPVKYEAMLKSTEFTTLEEMAITNRSPVVFPTSEPTTRNPIREVAFVSRGGNKKRKLKKKVKPEAEVPFAEATAPFTPPVDSVIEVKPIREQPKISQITPIYEYIDEPVVNIFQPIRYTDVINTLSSLTAQTFGSDSRNDTQVVPIIDNVSPINNSSIIDDSNAIKNTNGSVSDILEINLSMDNNLSPIDIMLDQLKLAIEEKDLKKIKNIVQAMDDNEDFLGKQKSEEIYGDKKSDKLLVSTESMPSPPTTQSVLDVSTKFHSIIYSAPKVRVTITESTTIEDSKDDIAISSIPVSTEPPALIIPTTLASRIYLAPKVRAAQKKLKQVKAKALFDDIYKESSTEAVTEVPTKLKSTTEKRNLLTVVKAEPLNVRPTKRKRSQITSRNRNIVRTVTHRNGGRSTGRRQ